MPTSAESRAGGASVSILIETANLSTAELRCLSECLRSLERQTHPIADVREVVVLDASEVPGDELRQVCQAFPWVELRPVGSDVGYGNVKALSAAHARGEIIVLCDSDCRYEPEWLERLLEPLAQRPDIQILSGETTTPISGPYSLAIALTFVFPRFSGERELAPALWYWANNVAVRKSAFERLPLPSDLPVYRGQNVVHASLLAEHRQTVWRQPLARAWHQLPRPGQLVARYLRFGEDSVMLAKLADDRAGRFYRRGIEPNARPIGRARHFVQRARSVLGEDPSRLVLLVPALPVVLACVVCYAVGMARCRLRFAVHGRARSSVGASA
jgi:glycosyltransferase involved in cell wall biosynthesis